MFIRDGGQGIHANGLGGLCAIDHFLSDEDRVSRENLPYLGQIIA